MPFFSIIVPTVNRHALLPRALDSVLAQDFDDFEVVVVDSASTDRTRDVVREYAARDPRVRLVTAQSRESDCCVSRAGGTTARSRRTRSSGERLHDLRYGLRAMARQPLSLRGWMILLSGLIHRKVLARSDGANMRMRGCPAR